MENKKSLSPKVSIVIPVYNVEKYLPRCLDSAVNQTLKDIEIIVVNDGSKDNSLEVIKEYVEKDRRVKLIDKPNSGYGNSMNRGIAAAKGDYIGILESDDFIAENMYESLYALTNDGTVDIVKGNFYDYFDYDGKAPVITPNNERSMIPDSKEPFTLRENAQISWGHPSVWSAIYRREFLLENNIVFMEEKGGGWVDNPFFYETLCKAKSIMWTNEAFYYYYKSNPDSSSNLQLDPKIPFLRMSDNLDILEKNGFIDRNIKRRAYSRALIYLKGAIKDFDYDANEIEISEYANSLMKRLDRDCISEDFTLEEQLLYNTYLSPLKKISAKFPKILIYNWLPFDNPWGWGGGVTVYCKNIIEEILKKVPTVSIYFLSSGFAYDGYKDKIYYRKIDNIFGDKVHQYEIVNSPVPADQRNMYINPLVALENQDLKNVFNEFLEKYGPFKTIHFNNIEGLSLDVLDLKEEHSETKFIFSIHNYVPLCVNGAYYMRHKHCNCNPDHTGEDCIKCTRADIKSKIALETYERGKFGHDSSMCISQNRWIKKFGFERLDIDATADNILDFAKTATSKLNKNCDSILAVSKRVYEIAEDNGFDTSKMYVSYIGTKVASIQCGKQAYMPKNGLKIIFLGNDINYEEKGYPFLLDALSEMPEKYAKKIDLVLTVKQKEHAEIYTMLKNFRSIRVINGYTHADLPNLFKDCNLSLVPVLWEDNLPQIAIESVAYGVPVLASSAGGASELCDSELFRFTAGSAEELNSKIMHFVDQPDDLNEYWAHHHGLVTMSQHIDELLKYYDINTNEKIQISIEDYGKLLNENEFLHKHISLNENTFTPNPVLEDLRNQLWQAREENERLKKEKKAMSHLNGKVTFQTEYDPAQGATGVNLFRLILEDFDFSDLYAEIKFIKLQNVSASASGTLRISGTWHGNEGSRKIDIHQCEWLGGEQALKDNIIVYTDENSVIFFGKHFGRACGYDYDVTVLTSRADHDSVQTERINQGFIQETEEPPKSNIVSYTAISNEPETSVPTVVADPPKKTFLSRLRGN